ncbi:FecR family protein [Compostibacter hankyongensis]|uniref:DUF4974 domain-containing protein n=1 Tax=Compostibacter hankyongensis TaxID=1007089 RepID=A0ABP8FUI0_9BACT
MNTDHKRLAYLFRRYFSQTVTAEEEQELMDLISRDGHTEELKALMDEAWATYKTDMPLFSPGQSDAMLHRIMQEKENGEETAVRSRKGEGKRIRWLRAAAVAALLILPAAGGFILWQRARNPLKTPVASRTMPPGDDIAPGSNKAVLVLANGTSIPLDSSGNGLLTRQGSTRVLKLRGGQLAYEAQGEKRKASDEVSFNTLTTPPGGEYQVVLPDNSKVWLNAASSLRFPTAFTTGKREVELTGEAYFEVAEDKDRPFEVKVNDMHVKVLGTHFNVMAYGDESSVKTTLLEGGVKVSQGETEALLKPGQQADLDKSARHIRIRKADMEEVMAWKEGLFHFDGDDLPSIMRKIARWYDMEVSYEEGLPAGHFTGVISRDNNLAQVLKVLELSGIHFSIEGRTIRVKQ